VQLDIESGTICRRTSDSWTFHTAISDSRWRHCYLIIGTKGNVNPRFNCALETRLLIFTLHPTVFMQLSRSSHTFVVSLTIYNGVNCVDAVGSLLRSWKQSVLTSWRSLCQNGWKLHAPMPSILCLHNCWERSASCCHRPSSFKVILWRRRSPSWNSSSPLTLESARVRELDPVRLAYKYDSSPGNRAKTAMYNMPFIPQQWPKPSAILIATTPGGMALAMVSGWNIQNGRPTNPSTNQAWCSLTWFYA